MVERKFEITYPQKMICNTEKFFPNTGISNNTGLLLVKSFDIPTLKKAINKFIQDNDAMRIKIKEEEGTIYQMFRDFEEYVIPECYFNSKNELFQFADDWKNQCLFNQDKLFKMVILRTNSEMGLLVTFHHVIADGLSVVNFFNEIFKIYDCLKNNLEYVPNKMQYKSFIEKEKDYLESEKFVRDMKFWNEEYNDVPEFTNLKNAISMSKISKRKTFVIDKKTDTLIKDFCSLNNVSYFNLFLGGLAIYISKLTNKNDISLSTTVLNREKAKEKEIFGMITNMIPVRLKINTDNSLHWLKEVNKKFFECLRHSKCPQEIINKQFIQRTGNSSGMYDINFTYQTGHLKLSEIFESWEDFWLGYSHQLNSMNIQLTNRNEKSNLILNIDYQCDIYSDLEVEIFFQGLITIIKNMLTVPQETIDKLKFLSEKELNLISSFNNTDNSYKEPFNLVDILKNAVKKYGTEVAASYKDEYCTYNELDIRSDLLAKSLIKNGIKKEDIIPIITNRSLEMLYGILGTIKSGAAYLPIAPDTPIERINYILRDCNAKICLVETELDLKIAIKTLALDYKKYEREIVNEHIELPTIDEKNLAYVIYTSGSSGTPKGVMIEHKSIVNRLYWMSKEINLKENETILMKTPYTFDVSVVEMFWWFFNGANVRIAKSGSEKEPDEILEEISNNKVVYVHFVPSMLEAFLEYGKQKNFAADLSSLKWVVASGEALNLGQVKNFYNIFDASNTTLYNFYGPTETAVDVTFYKCKDNEINIPIGRPIDNTKIHILNEKRELVPIGCVGEIYISGRNVGRGYLNLPERTSESFVIDIFDPSEKMYKTGDLGSWNIDGTINYIGRKDNQVKVRGYRIELGEIERHLVNLNYIQKAIVLLSAKKKLICFYIQNKLEHVTSDIIAKDLQKSIPSYMIPNEFVKMEEFPINSNGKIDRKKILLMSDKGQIKEKREKESLEEITYEESILKTIWEEVLDNTKLGILDNFFMLGGDSIKAIQIITKLHKYGYTLKISDFFEGLNIKSIALLLKKENTQQQYSTENVQTLTPIQNWYFDEYGYDNQSKMNQIMLFKLSPDVDVEHLKNVINIFLKNVDIFSSYFEKIGNEIFWKFQKNSSQTEIKLTNIKEIKECTSRNSEIDITSGKPFEIRLFQVNSNKYLYIAATHLIVDTISWINIIRKLEEYYYGGLSEQKKEPIFNYSNILKQELSYFEENEMNYWKKQKASMGENTLIRQNRIIKSIKISDPYNLMVIKKQQSEKNVDAETILLGTLYMTLYEISKAKKVFISLERHGRESSILGEDIFEKVGWFTSRFPIAIETDENENIQNVLETVKKCLTSIPNSGIGYSVLKYYGHHFQDYSEPDIAFNYLGNYTLESPRGLFKGILSESHLEENTKEIKSGINLDITAILNEDTLNIDFKFNKNRYTTNEMEQFLSIFKNYFKKIIEHLDKEEEGKYLKYINKDNELDTEEIANIFAQIEQ